MTSEAHIHMIGVGGIGMSALAQLYVSRGSVVTGSDRAASVVTDLLETKGISIHIGHKAEAVIPNTHFVVYSDAVPKDNPERTRARELGIPELSYFQALGQISSHMDTIAVSGTHGKTTTTAMLALILRHCGKNPTAVIGSLVKDFGSNFVKGSSDLLVVEACEYRDHLLELSPRILVITNVEWDHTDWFTTEVSMIETFNKAARRVPRDGFIITHAKGAHMSEVLEGCAATVIDCSEEKVPPLMLIGSFNIQNAQAAKAAAKAFAIELVDTDIDQALMSFQGSWRRFEKKGVMKVGALVYDDYAHHPTAIEATIRGVRESFPDKRILLVFHPHLYTRTRDLFVGFAEALALADDVVIAPIFAAREDSIDGITSEALADAVSQRNAHVCAMPTFDAIESYVRAQATENTLVLTMGAGDIYKVAEALIAG